MARTNSAGHDRLREEEPPNSSPQTEAQVNAEFAKAFQELARGEQTASALESRLSGIESKIEQLLALAEEHAREQKAEGDSSKTSGKPVELSKDSK